VAKDVTRQNIIREGARLIHAKGFNNTGLSDILKAARVPKGSFYFYFRNKEDFGIAVVDYYIDMFESLGRSALNDPGTPPLQRLSGLFDLYQKNFERMDLRCGCPIGNLTQEMSDHSELFRTKVGEAYSLVIGEIEKCLSEAKELGDLSQDLDIQATALFIFNSWEGAIMHMKLSRSVEPLKVFKRMVFVNILGCSAG
jgi:TetR/AcrR family transcriptional repressor of nem operon